MTGLGRSLKQLATVSERIRELQNLTTLKGAVLRLYCSFFNRELERSVFERRTSTGSGLLASLDSGLVETLG